MFARSLSSLVPLALLLGLGPVPASAGTLQVLQGYPVTGLNRLLGQPINDFGAVAGQFGFDTVAAYQPGASQPAPLTPESPGSTLLATVVDPVVLQVFGVDPALVDPALLNLPLREVPSNIDPGGIVRSPLPPHLAAPVLAPSQAEPAAPITLDTWLRATGLAIVSCPDEGNSMVDLRLRGLLPNRLYTVWAPFVTSGGPLPIPLGGAPNTISTDEDGRGSYHRTLSFCPFDLTPDGNRMLTIDVVFHSDQMVYSYLPALPSGGYPPGVIAHAQLEFRVFGTPLP